METSIRRDIDPPGVWFQKNLVVWKLGIEGEVWRSATCVSEELSSVETGSFSRRGTEDILVSEELSSVET